LGTFAGSAVDAGVEPVPFEEFEGLTLEGPDAVVVDLEPVAA
jgi:hypothetical protein